MWAAIIARSIYCAAVAAFVHTPLHRRQADAHVEQIQSIAVHALDQSIDSASVASSRPSNPRLLSIPRGRFIGLTSRLPSGDRRESRRQRRADVRRVSVGHEPDPAAESLRQKRT